MWLQLVKLTLCCVFFLLGGPQSPPKKHTEVHTVRRLELQLLAAFTKTRMQMSAASVARR